MKMKARNHLLIVKFSLCILLPCAVPSFGQVTPPRILKDEEVSLLPGKEPNVFQHRNMSEEEMTIRKLKILKTDISNFEILNSLLSAFDKNYREYRDNEFELNKRANEYRKHILEVMSHLKELEIFYHDLSSYTTFGEYDFQNNKFKFEPFKVYEEENGNTNKHLEIYGYRHEPLASEILIKNLDFVRGLPLPSKEADALLKSKTTKNIFGSEKIDRTVFIRVYYAVHNDRLTKITPKYVFGGTEDDECLLGEPLRIEVWGDECRQNNLLAVYYPNKLDLSSKFHNLFDKLYMTKLENRFEGHSATDNFKSIISWSQVNKECEREELELHLKKQKNLQSEQDILLIRLYTNYRYNIKPGFVFSFYNKETKVEFPLVIYETVVDKAAALLKIKITKQTLNEIVNSDCYCFRLQLTGNPKYQISGEGVLNDNTTNNRNLSIADFYLSEEGKTILFSILKQ